MEMDEKYNNYFILQRNPAIKLYGLPWAFPGWLGVDGSPFKNPEATAGYITKWILGAKNVHNLTIDYIGVLYNSLIY